MHITEVEGNRLQGQIDLPGHQVEVIDVGGQPEVGVGTALVGRHHQLAAVDLELHEAEARRLIGLRIGGAEEEHIILAAALLPVDSVDEWRQLLEVGGVTVHQRMAAVIPPTDTRLPVFLHTTLTVHKEPQFVPEFAPGDIMPLEDVEQVGRSQRERLVKQVAARAFPAGLRLSGGENLVQ